MKKLLLLVFSMTLVLFLNLDALAQQANVVKVANNNELIKALADPNVQTIEITVGGFYDALLFNAAPGALIKKGNRGVDADCIYTIQPTNTCFLGDPTASVVVADATQPPGGGADCPPDDAGVWTVEGKPLGAPNPIFIDDDTTETMHFTVAIAGTYEMRYSWGAPYNTFVQTSLTFFDTPHVTNLKADSSHVCGNGNEGWITDIIFDYSVPAGATDTTVTWTITGPDAAAALTPADPQLPGTFDFTADECGMYTIEVLVEGGGISCGTADSTINVYFYDQALVNAGPNDTTCGLTYDWQAGFPNYTIPCTNILDVSTLWTTVGTPPGAVVFNGSTGVEVDVCGTYLFAYVVQNGPCAVHDTVEITFYEAPEITGQAPDGETCGLEYYLPVPVYETFGVCGTVTTGWSLAATPASAGTIVSLVDNDVEVSACGEYYFVFTVGIEESDGCVNTDTVKVYFYDMPIIDDMQDSTGYCGLEGELFGGYTAACDSGNAPVESWIVVDAPSGSTIVTFSDDLDSVFVDVCGEYLFKYGVQNGVCGASETIAMFFFDTPIVDAGPDTSVCGLVYEGIYAMAGYTVACDTGSGPSHRWYANPVNPLVVFDEQKDLVEVPACGAYEFIYEVTNGACVETDTMSVFFYDVPVANAGENDSVCGSNANAPVAGIDVAGYFATLTGSNEAQCVNGGSSSVKWELVADSSDGTVISWSPDQLQDTVDIEVTTCGRYYFMYSVASGDCADTAYVWVNFYNAPVVDAGPDVELCEVYTYTFDPTYTLECANDPLLDSIWSVLTQPYGGNAQFNGHTVTVQECGTYQFLYTVRNGTTDEEYSCNGSDIVYMYVYDKPVVDAGENDSVCVGTPYLLEGSYELDCDNEFPPTVKWTKVSGPGWVMFDPVDADQDDVTIQVDPDSCGTYVFQYKVVNGTCEDSATVSIDFFDQPIFVVDGAYPIPDSVCGYETDPFFLDYEVNCTFPIRSNGVDGEWTTQDGAYIEYAELERGGVHNMWVASADSCGEYWFTYTVTNGPCSNDTTIKIHFFDAPVPIIVGDTMVYTCSTTEYCAEVDACGDVDYEFTWIVAGGVFAGNGEHTITATCVDVIWDNVREFPKRALNPGGHLTVFAVIPGLDDEACEGFYDMPIYKQYPTLEGQIKYWNLPETYMPTPYATDDYQTIPFDYFYVTLYEVLESQDPEMPLMIIDSVATVYVQARLTEDLEELMSYFDFEINTEENELGCESMYMLKVWDGGMIYHTTPPAPDEETKLGGSTYTYNNWGGVNATDALAIQLMVGGLNDINGTPWNYSWVGLNTDSPWYGYYSHGIADVNSSNTYTNGGITALDALTAKYRTVGNIASYPDNGSTNQFSPNFRVTGRMVDSLPQKTFMYDRPFDYDNVEDVPFTHSGADYMYFSYATAHKYTSSMVPWEGAANYINLYYEAIGDVNASYIPPGSGLKAEPTVTLTYEGMFAANVGEVVTIPINIDRDVEVGAITLSFNYRNDLIEVLGTNYDADDMFINQEEGILNMAWFSTESVDYIADAAVALIKVRIIEEIPADVELFELNVNTEFADATANPIDVDLKTSGVSTDKGLVDGAALTASNYPNPFNDATTISYLLPEMGKVTVDVYNNMGMKVATLVDEVQESGLREIVFNTGDVNPGVYFYHITLQGETKDYSAVKRMIVVN